MVASMPFAMGPNESDSEGRGLVIYVPFRQLVPAIVIDELLAEMPNSAHYAVLKQ